MNRRKPRRTLSVVPVYATGPDVPTLDEVRAQALPVLTRVFVSAIRAKQAQKQPSAFSLQAFALGCPFTTHCPAIQCYQH